MRVDTAVLSRFSSRAPFAAALVCAALAVTGCASRGERTAAIPVTTNAAAPGDPGASNASGAQTITTNKLQRFLWVFSPYRPDIQQGNFVSREMMEQVKVGQTRDQIKFILGTPLLTDAFHADRWDYPFYLARGNGELTSARVTIYFKNDVVERFEGGNLPTEQEYIARIAGPAKVLAKDAPKREEVGAAAIKINK
jgi:outer membrane protein assembly factor BamE